MAHLSDPSVRTEDEVILIATQRHLLHELVMRGYWHRNGLEEAERTALRLPAIRALGLLGNFSSISVLERCARKTTDLALRQSALQSIEEIRERLKYGPEVMLRASQAPEHPEMLLRAVSGDKPQNWDGWQLLRADHADVEPQGEVESQRPGQKAPASSASGGRIKIK